MEEITCGNCLEVLLGIPDCSVDAVVTDPPYGLSFMGKEWDHSVPSAAVWREVLRVLKPGGHLLVFAGTRTQHRMACNIEDAGFEIRDMLAWIYGSGFPKSLDVSKAIDKAAGAVREVVGRTVTPFRVDAAASRGNSLVGSVNGDFSKQTEGGYRYTELTAPATEAAKQWSGWGTALKPALEPITMARKPLAGTVAANVLKHGTGALNVDGCRVNCDGGRPLIESKSEKSLHAFGDGLNGSRCAGITTQGRWPANLIHDDSEEVADLLGEAKRFFYCPKASRKERGEDNNHPTVKPVELMRYLVRLVTPPGGLVLDPFCGSGTTGIACRMEGFAFHGIELNPEYAALARKRISGGEI